MSAPFLTTTVANMRIAIEVAWGADLTDLTGAGWTWSDITADVILDKNQVSITVGRPDYSAETQAAELVCELDNRDGEWSAGGLSEHWPHVRRGTPIRVRLSTNAGSSWTTRFQGSVVGFTPHWDTVGRWATATLVAAGPLRRINQGTEAATSVYAQLIPTDTAAYPGLQFYWNNEGGNGMTAVEAVTPKITGSNILTYALSYLPQVVMSPNADAFPISAPLPGQFSMSTAPTSVTSTGDLQFRFMMTHPGLPEGNIRGTVTPNPPWQPMMQFKTSASSSLEWGWEIDIPGGMRLTNTSGYDSGGINFNLVGSARLYQLQISSGGDWEMATLAQDGTAGVFSDSASGSIGRVTHVWFNGCNINADIAPFVVGHMTIQNQLSAINGSALVSLFKGKPGETPQARLARLCTAAQLPLTTLTTTTTVTSTSIVETMGPQYWDTFTTLMRECERTAQGMLYDGLGPGLTFITKRAREDRAAGPATLVLDASAGHLMAPFAPTDDDQQTVNRCDVTRRNATSVSHTDLTGRLGVHAIGEYATSIDVNTNSDVGLVRYGEWLVNLGSREGYRYPSVSFALETNPSLIAGWLACAPQSRIDITNISSIRRQHPPEPIWLLLEGWHETIGAFTWQVTANTSSAEPWNVVRLAAATGSTGDDICHMDTDGSQLNASAALGATSITVKTISGPLWVTSAADADSFPFDIEVGGCRVTVTAVSGASSPQTFTLASPGLPRALTGSSTTGAGAPIKVWRQAVFGL